MTELDGKKKRNAVVGGFVLMVIGLIFFGAGLLIRSSTMPDAGDIVVEGRVVDVQSVQGRNGRLYAVAVEYTDADSGQVYVTTNGPRTSNRPTIGDVREVAYPPADPSDGEAIGGSWFAWVFLGAGAVLVLMSLGVLVTRLKSAVRSSKLLSASTS